MVTDISSILSAYSDLFSELGHLGLSFLKFFDEAFVFTRADQFFCVLLSEDVINEFCSFTLSWDARIGLPFSNSA
jgi:hypothetical protein